MKADLEKGFGIEIEGEIGKHNSIAGDRLILIIQNFQKLVNAIAESHVPDSDALDLNCFKIHVNGFKKASAVPNFIFSPIHQTNISDVHSQRKLVAEKIDEIFDITAVNNYEEFKTRYRIPKVRNEIVEASYSFFNSFDDSPFSVVETDTDKIIPLYKLHKFPKEIKDSLLTSVIGAAKVNEVLYTGVARFKTVKTPEGKIKNEVDKKHLFTGSNVNPSCIVEAIQFENTTYLFHSPLNCILTYEDEAYFIKSDLLDIVGTGSTQDEASNDFAEEFNFIYATYLSTEDSKLSDRLLNIKKLLQIIVKEIIK